MSRQEAARRGCTGGPHRWLLALGIALALALPAAGFAQEAASAPEAAAEDPRAALAAKRDAVEQEIANLRAAGETGLALLHLLRVFTERIDEFANLLSLGSLLITLLPVHVRETISVLHQTPILFFQRFPSPWL